MRHRKPEREVLAGARIVVSEDAGMAVMSVEGWRVDWTVSRKKTPSTRFYAPPPSARKLADGKTHLMRRRDAKRGTVLWRLVEKEPRTAVRSGQKKRPLPPPPQPSCAIIVAPVGAGRFAPVQKLFPGCEEVRAWPRHIGWG